MQSFLLVHISDLHLAERPNMIGWQDGVGKRQLLARLLRQHKNHGLTTTAFTGSYDEHVGNELLALLDAFLAVKELSAILVTGDVATIGSRRDILAAKRWLSGDNGSGVSLPKEKILVMPGNHDRFFGTLPLLSGSKRFEHDDAFGPRWDQSPKVRLRPEYVCEHKIPGPSGDPGLSIICADFALSWRHSIQKPVLHLDEGLVEDSTLAALIQATTSAQEDGWAVVWAIHFPPNFPGEVFRKKLRGFRRLLAAARACEVDYIFSGHTHKQIAYRTGFHSSPVTVFCAGTAMCDGAENHAFFLHEVLVLDRKVNDVSTREYTFSSAGIKPNSKGFWEESGTIVEKKFIPVRFPWLQRLGY